MKIAIVQFVTLDGVAQGPGSAEEDTTDGFTRGGWFVPHLDEAFVQQASDWLDLADGLLLGRRTYEAFARDWPQIPEPDPLTARMNTLPKYVVSTTLDEGSWQPTTVLDGVLTESIGEPGWPCSTTWSQAPHRSPTTKRHLCPDSPSSAKPSLTKRRAATNRRCRRR